MDSAPAVSTPRAGSWPSGSWRVPWRQSCQPLSCISSVHAGGEEEGPLSPTAAASGQRRAGCGWERQAKGQARCSWSLCPPDGARARAEPPAHAAARGVLWLRRRLGDGWGGRPRRFPGPCPRGMVPRTPWPDAPRLRGEAGFCHPKRHSVGWGRVARRWEGVAGWLRSEGVSLARWAADLSSQQQQACPWDVQVWRLSPAWCLASGRGASGGECGTSAWWCFGGRT